MKINTLEMDSGQFKARGNPCDELASLPGRGAQWRGEYPSHLMLCTETRKNSGLIGYEATIKTLPFVMQLIEVLFCNKLL